MEKNEEKGFEVIKELMYLETDVFKSKEGKEYVKHRFFDYNNTIEIFDDNDKNLLQQIQQKGIKEKDEVITCGNLKIKQVANNFAYFNYVIKKIDKK